MVTIPKIGMNLCSFYKMQCSIDWISILPFLLGVSSMIILLWEVSIAMQVQDSSSMILMS